MTKKNISVRYSRQLGIKDWGIEGQTKIENSKVFIAGAGGIGSPVMFYLSAAGIGSMTICDFDRIELSNLNRQILHAADRIGIYKSESAVETLFKLNSDPVYKILTELITEKNAASLVEGYDLVIDCFDNFISRHILNKACYDNGIPLIHGGVAGFQGQISFIHPPETPCLSCFLPKKNTKGTTFIAGASAGVVGSLQAVEALKYLTGIGSSLKNKILFWDGLAMRMETINITKNPKCKICGKEK